MISHSYRMYIKKMRSIVLTTLGVILFSILYNKSKKNEINSSNNQGMIMTVYINSKRILIKNEIYCLNSLWNENDCSYTERVLKE